MPKPLLSGYFTNQLNSVHNINVAQKSLEDSKELELIKEAQLDHDLELLKDQQAESAMTVRPQLKIKQSLNRDFSIENLKRAANNKKSKL